MKLPTATPYTASYVVFLKGDSIAFLLRGNTGYMDGQYGLPSGKVELDETFTACAIREAKEEVGITILPQNLDPVLTVHRKGEDGTYWVDMYYAATEWEGELYNAEPDKHSELVWFSPEYIPKNIVPAVRFSLEQIGKNRTYTEYGWDVIASK